MSIIPSAFFHNFQRKSPAFIGDLCICSVFITHRTLFFPCHFSHHQRCCRIFTKRSISIIGRSWSRETKESSCYSNYASCVIKTTWWVRRCLFSFVFIWIILRSRRCGTICAVVQQKHISLINHSSACVSICAFICYIRNLRIVRNDNIAHASFIADCLSFKPDRAPFAFLNSGVVSMHVVLCSCII